MDRRHFLSTITLVAAARKIVPSTPLNARVVEVRAAAGLMRLIASSPVIVGSLITWGSAGTVRAIQPSDRVGRRHVVPVIGIAVEYASADQSVLIQVQGE